MKTRTTNTHLGHHLLLSPFVLLLLGVLLSCQQNQPEKFNSSSPQRVEQFIVQARDILTSSPQGWVMEYYPGDKNQIYGGYPLIAKFDKQGYVTFWSNYTGDPTKPFTSLYAFKKDVGPTLNFDSYNKVFHLFSDPDNTSGKGLSHGLDGDYEFILKTVTPQEVVMEGKKKGSIIHLYPLKQEPLEYLKKAEALRQSYANIPAVMSLEGTLGTESVTGERLSEQYIVLNTAEDQAKLSFMFTDQGIKLYQPVQLAGKTIKDLQWDPQEKLLSSSDGLLKLKLVSDPFGLPLDQLLGAYTLQYNLNKSADVTIVRSPSTGEILLQGLPFDIVLDYSEKKGALEIHGQRLDIPNKKVFLAIWDTEATNLTWTEPTGLITKWNGSMDDFQLSFVANDYPWVHNSTLLNADAFILWDSGKGEYKDFGMSQFVKLKLVKKK